MPATKDQEQNIASELAMRELDQIHQAIRTYDGHRWQLATFFGSVNISAVALGLSLTSYGIVLIASVLLVLIFLGDLMLKPTLAVPLYRAFKIERFFSNDETAFFRLYVGMHTRNRYRKEFLRQMDEIVKLDDAIEIPKRLRELFGQPYAIRSGVTMIVTLGFIIEILLGLALAILGWPAFPPNK